MALALLGLLPLWVAGMFGRGLWTPDEPREADIAWRMSQQAELAIPRLAGQPFLEKPPLSYWMSAAGIRLFGDRAGGARAPNLFYAALTTICVTLLALELGMGPLAALLAAYCSGSALLVWRVESWLAPDACLLAGNALALLGLWRGYRAAPGRAKLLGYTLMHAGAALGFMAKSAPGWLVPALALLTLLAWERRFAELRRIELYAGLALQALVIGPWLLALSAGAEGAQPLRVLFWHNLVGRFTQVPAPPPLDYTSGHRNWPGKYFCELPLYLLPWTLLALAAAVRAARRVRADSAWRFAVCATLPWLVILSLAATARDVYAAPALLGAALLIGLWARSAPNEALAIDVWCVRLSRALVVLLVLALAAAVLALAAAKAAPRASVLGCMAGLLLIAGLLCWPRRRGRAAPGALLQLYAGYAGALCLCALLVMPAIDRAQDLGSLAWQVRADTAGAPLALYDPDETTLAIIDHGAAAVPVVLPHAGASEVQRWFATQPAAARLLVLLPGRGAGPLDALRRDRTGTPRDDGAAAALQQAGAARLVQRYELPHGRRYALLAPPLPSTSEPSS
ncbi:MAG: phospholipid carrier-dependent glycosyltransferase [Gammaproteobacteria bacterium]|nr:phospholipid carrier-dependent glycosyltransferase [Gammaproteobacteria bacterium]